MKLISVTPSTREGKKYDALFDIDGKKKKVSFGLAGSFTYLDHKDTKKREAYLARHKVREDWENPLTPGSLSRWILWNEPNLPSAIRFFKQKFNL